MGQPFESIAEAERRARRRLPEPLCRAIVSGTEAGRTRDRNVEAFAELEFAPALVGSPSRRQVATTVMGVETAMPVLVSPTGVQALHPEGEVAVARAAARLGAIQGLSSFGSRPIEQVIAANPNTFLQLYWMGSRQTMAARVERARAAGCKGLILTLDWCFPNGPDEGRSKYPERLTLGSSLAFAPMALSRPGWLWAFLRRGELPELKVPNLDLPGEPRRTITQGFVEWAGTPPATWNDVRWLAELWGGPLMVKGICRIDDARRAIDAGASAISVSNHGGNNLDGSPAAIRLLSGVARAVGDQAEVLLDGGVRRGGDVVKALALGARAVLIGRAYLWGLGAGGEAGVARVLEILRQGVDSTLLGLGRSGVADVRREDVIAPPGFHLAC